MRLGSTLKAAAITKYISKLIINFNSKTFTNSKRGSKAMWEQVKKIVGSEKSLNTSTVQHIDANTLNTHFASMSTDHSYKISPTKATTINSHQHQQFTPYSVLHILTKACPSGKGPDGLQACKLKDAVTIFIPFSIAKTAIDVIKTICFLSNVAIEIASNQDCFRFWLESNFSNIFSRLLLDRVMTFSRFSLDFLSRMSKHSMSIQQTVETNPPHLDVSPGFSSTERAIPAVLLRCLLLRAGIEANPGPPKIWICPGCHQRINKTQYSARCRTCYNWHHLNNCLTNINGHYYCNNCPLSSPVLKLKRHVGVCWRLTAANFNIIIQQLSPQQTINITCTFQESKLTKGSKNPVFKEYAIYRKNRRIGRGGGLILLIHNSITYSIESLPDVPTIESQAITFNASDTDINIINIYIPPQSTCPTGFTALKPYPNFY
ncbi:hypothetical protein HELRODRAFT_158637 [Helobdella robusta]|uniref:Uncharacterized protein n=1 Tax=Helobdella robusta TaxID=6412 RepID=T1EN22_HELRO|nr:hypothetical protein HELRODRAFT_158637 [Helobdella robusta]ESO12174.1 hypothetical protein HELRODRAFT_158637 [Helobdella robusta]